MPKDMEVYYESTAILDRMVHYISIKLGNDMKMTDHKPS